MSKTLIFNFDGTNNDPSDAQQNVDAKGNIDDDSITNILKFHLLIGGRLTKLNTPLKNGSRSFYYAGVGTYGNFFQRKFNAGLAKEAYDVATIINTALADFQQYYLNDTKVTTILVTGFSRGAAIARRFAALINDKVRDKCIIEGVFDTVAAIGLPHMFTKKLPKTDVLFEHGCELPSNVKHALHLVALDEKRKAFSPTLMNYREDVVHEVWFPGAHSDIGGGFFYDGLADNCLTFFLNWFNTLNLEIEVLTATKIQYDKIFDDNKQLISLNDIQIKPNITGLNHEQRRKFYLRWTLADRICGVLNHDVIDPTMLPVVHVSVAHRVLSNASYRPNSLSKINHWMLAKDSNYQRYYGYEEYLR